MEVFDDLPQREISHDTAEEAITAFRASIEATLFVIQGEDINDYGTDIQIEARDGKAMTNLRAHIQLKGTESAANGNGSVSVAVKRVNLNYLLGQPDSMYICYHRPSKRLLVRYAEDVYREYERRGADWHHQQSVTINFTDIFDLVFQQRLNARLLASGRSSRDRRFRWAVTPPKSIPALVECESTIVEVPVDAAHSGEVLAELYRAGRDDVISGSFARFAAVLSSLPGAMDLAYMAEINLAINGSPFDRDRVRQAVNVIEDAIKKGEAQTGTLLYCLGNAWLALDDPETARDTYRKSLSQLSLPGLSRIAAKCSKNLGSALEKLGETQEARQCYERALELDCDLAEAHFALALWYYRGGDAPRKALEHLDRVIPQSGNALQSKMPVVQGWRAGLLFNTGDSEGAFREIHCLLGDASKLEWVWPWCARLVAQFGKTSPGVVQKALRFWRAYLKVHRADARAKREQLLCRWHQRAAGECPEVDFNAFKLGVVQLIEGGDPDPAYLWDRVGHWSQYDGDWIEAEAGYRKAYELDPTRYSYCLGTALNFLGRHQEALSILIPLVHQKPPKPRSWFQVARAREGLGDIRGSISAYRKALKIDAAYDLAWFNLGGLYWNSGDIDRATQTLREAVVRFPDHKLTRRLLTDFPLLFE
jgi:tetratricopeptide (TPR) repeat protein